MTRRIPFKPYQGYSGNLKFDTLVRGCSGFQKVGARKIIKNKKIYIIIGK
jgi:hypothetical protein